jgi:hypothetical protein
VQQPVSILTERPLANNRYSITRASRALPGISATAKLVLAALLDHRNPKTGQCNPKRVTLAEELGLDPSPRRGPQRITRALAELRHAGVLCAKKSLRCNYYAIQDGEILRLAAAAQTTQNRASQTTQRCASPTLLTEPVKKKGAAASVGVDKSTPAAAAVGAPAHAAAATPSTPTAKKPPASAEYSADFAIVREALNGLARVAHLFAPDDGIVDMVLGAARGAKGAEIAETLVALWKTDQLRKMRGWGFVPLKIADCYRRASA